MRDEAASAFHPELRRVARVLPRTILTPLTLRVFRALPTRRAPGGDGVEVAELGSGVGIRVHRPPVGTGDDITPAVLWVHGGGYVLGHAGMDDGLCQRMARDLGAVVADVDYRLAPEHPYPAALQDCYDALRWLSSHRSVDPTRVAVAGASAGGGLAAALAQLTRDRGEVALAAQLLRYPMLDDRTGLGPDPGSRHRRMWNTTSNRLGWQAYLGDADPVVAVPARREDLHGVAPAWIGVGTLDVLHDEAVTYAQRLHGAGVPCEVELVTGAFHGFDAVAPRSSVARRFYSSQLTFLRHTFDER